MVPQILGLAIFAWRTHTRQDETILTSIEKHYSTLDDTHSKQVLLPHQDQRPSHTCGDSNRSQMKHAYVTLVFKCNDWWRSFRMSFLHLPCLSPPVRPVCEHAQRAYLRCFIMSNKCNTMSISLSTETGKKKLNKQKLWLI